MTNYQYRRTVFYQTRPPEDFPDNHKNFDIIWTPETAVEDAVDYLLLGGSHTRFPGASYAVALATSRFIEINFKADFFSTLSDKNLMHNNDPYFKTYNENKKIYDLILSKIPREQINWDSYRMKITHNLLLEEYLLDEKGKKVLPYA